MRYRCFYISGSGTEYEEGIFEETNRTEKEITLKMTRKGPYANYPSRVVRRIPLDRGRRNAFSPAAEHWGDGSFIVYHNQDGTPYTYEPILEADSTVSAAASNAQSGARHYKHRSSEAVDQLALF